MMISEAWTAKIGLAATRYSCTYQEIAQARHREHGCVAPEAMGEFLHLTPWVCTCWITNRLALVLLHHHEAGGGDGEMGK